jgi:hypothetical protein
LVVSPTCLSSQLARNRSRDRSLQVELVLILDAVAGEERVLALGGELLDDDGGKEGRLTSLPRWVRTMQHACDFLVAFQRRNLR